MACCDLLLVRCRCLQSSAKCKYTHYRSTYCLGLGGADVEMWECDPTSREFGSSRESTGEPLNSHPRILAPNWREITGVDCTQWSWVHEIKLHLFCNDLLHVTFFLVIKYIDGLVQEIRNSSALAMELRLSCTNPSIWDLDVHHLYHMAFIISM